VQAITQPLARLAELTTQHRVGIHRHRNAQYVAVLKRTEGVVLVSYAHGLFTGALTP